MSISRPLVLRLIHEVEGDNHRYAHVRELECNKKIALHVDGIHDVDDDIGVKDDVTGHPFFVVERGYPVDAGSVHNEVGPGVAARDLNGRAGVVRYVGIDAGEVAEKDRLAHVRIACEDDLSHGRIEDVPMPVLMAMSVLTCLLLQNTSVSIKVVILSAAKNLAHDMRFFASLRMTRSPK